MKAGLRQRLINSRLIRTERTAALQQQNDLFEWRALAAVGADLAGRGGGLDWIVFAHVGHPISKERVRPSAVNVRYRTPMTKSQRRPSIRLEIHRHAVDAIAQAGRRRTVRKHVAEMTAASAAMHLGA